MNRTLRALARLSRGLALASALLLAASACGGPAKSKAKAEARYVAGDGPALYDKDGHALLYLREADASTFYLWSGEPVAYLFEGRHVYAFDGDHLGWYQSERIYDNKGQILAAPMHLLRTSAKPLPAKARRARRLPQEIREPAPDPPVFKPVWYEGSARACFVD